MLTYYYPKTLFGITVALLNMFNEIKVVKHDSSGTSLGEKNVPITFAPTEKYHKDRIEDHYVDADNIENNQRYYLQIPRMAMTLNGIAYSPDRASGANQWRYWFQKSLGLSQGEIDQIYSDYQPTPYDYNFSLYIRTDHIDCLAQILENILPYFNPKLMLRVKEFSFLNIERDLPVSMDGVNPDFSDDMTENDSRHVNASINLTVEGWMYRPVVQSKVIKIINSNYYNYDTGVFWEGYRTSAYQTSAGNLVETSALPLSGDYFTSGSVSADTVVSGTDYGNNKEFVWFKRYEGSSATN